MFIAMLETTNFSFMAGGATEEEAIQAMCAGVWRHSIQTGADAEYMQQAAREDSVVVVMLPGACLRDREPI